MGRDERHKTVQLKELLETDGDALGKSSLLKECLSDLKGVGKELVHIVDYRLGERIIGGPPDSLVPDDCFEISDQIRIPTNDLSEGDISARGKLGLRGNPLYLVLGGFAEIHRYVDRGAETVPLLVVGPGEVFGEFEISLDAPTKKEQWRAYASQVTAGWRTVYVNASFSDQFCWDALLGEGPPDTIREARSPQAVARVLHQTFYRQYTYEDDGHKTTTPAQTFRTRVVIFPPEFIREMGKRSLAFMHNLNQIILRHVAMHIALTPVYSTQTARRSVTLSSFVSHVLPRLLRGDLPVLVPCTEYPCLENWWRTIHGQIDRHRSLRDLNLPFWFYVPASGVVAARAVKKGWQGGCMPPAVSQAALLALTRGEAIDCKGQISVVLKRLLNEDKVSAVNLVAVHKTRSSEKCPVYERRKEYVKKVLEDLFPGRGLVPKSPRMPGNRLIFLMPRD